MDKKHKHLDLSELVTLDTECIQGIFSHLNNGVTITDEDAKIIYVNPSFTRLTGYSYEEAVGGNPGMLHSGKHEKSFYQDMWNGIVKEGYWRGEIWNRNKSGAIYPEILTINRIKDAVHNKYYYVAIFEDVGFILGDQEKDHELAFYDPLTNLPNRNLLHDRFEQIEGHIERQNYQGKPTQMAVLFCDLNKFKQVNDVYGHVVGDIVLEYVATALKNAARKIDTVSHYGGDEFVILLPDVASKEVVIQFCDRINSALSKPLKHKDQDIYASISVGAAFFPEEADTFNDIIIAADVAMYQAKKEKLEYCFYQDLEKQS